ncbi:MAG: DUF1501 domain-containing protein, partial [Planctomycetales bacterium]|nr:DUF1501 domain-containing protein [Planctomycetales bacterium]
MFNAPSPDISRRQVLSRIGSGFGMLGLAGLLQNELLAQTARAAATAIGPAPHFPAKAKRVIVLFMSGGPSQVDTFDPKPMLKKYAGQRPESANIRTASPTTGLMPSEVKFIPSGRSGIPVADTMPKIASHIDDMAIIRSMHTDFPNHAPAL